MPVNDFRVFNCQVPNLNVQLTFTPRIRKNGKRTTGNFKDAKILNSFILLYFRVSIVSGML